MPAPRWLATGALDVCVCFALTETRGGSVGPSGHQHPAYAPQMNSYQGGSAGGGYREAQPAASSGGGGWNGWDDAGSKDDGEWRAPVRQPSAAPPKADQGKWAGWDAGDSLPDEVWDADWGK